MWRALGDIGSDWLIYASFATVKSVLRRRMAVMIERIAAIQRMISPVNQTHGDVVAKVAWMSSAFAKLRSIQTCSQGDAKSNQVPSIDKPDLKLDIRVSGRT